MGSTSSEDDEGWPRRRRRNARSLDIATSHTRDASKAAAWMWHMHSSSSSSPTAKTDREDKEANFGMWEVGKRRSKSCDHHRDSRFRQEAAVALKQEEASNSPKLPPDSSSIWDCGSKLYDTFELVSFSNRLDRSLLFVPPFDAPPAPNFCHAVPSPLHHSSFSNVLRTYSLPRTLSLRNSMPLTPPPHDDANHAEQPDVINANANGSSVTNHVPPLSHLHSTFGPPRRSVKPKFSALRRALATKWTPSKLVMKILKKVAKFHKQMQCFRLRARQDKNVISRRIELSIVNEHDDGGMSERRYFWWCASRNKNVRGRRETVGDAEDADGRLSEERRYRVYEEKVKQGKAGKQFHHHHHHYHHHFVHHLDQLSQAAKEDNAWKLQTSPDGSNRTDASRSVALPTRTESARLSSDTLSKICADVNWL